MARSKLPLPNYHPFVLSQFYQALQPNSHFTEILTNSGFDITNSGLLRVVRFFDENIGLNIGKKGNLARREDCSG